MRLEARNISFRYSKHSCRLIHDLSFAIQEGERIALSGPSGDGKTTLLKLLAGFELPDQGEILLDGMALEADVPCPVQLISQHPELAVNPRLKLKDTLAEAFSIQENMLEVLGIRKDWLERYPHELSGGELQRFCVARALGENTRFLLADEITSMLDTISQAQIWNYIQAEIERRKIGLIMVTHNLHLSERICGKKIVLKDINQAGE